MITITDNHKKPPRILKEDEIADLKEIGNKKISELKDLLLLGFHKDRIVEQKIFELSNGCLTTGNIMGFVGKGNTQLRITSRFAQSDKNDYFLHYMLQKVLSINLFDFEQKEGYKDKFYDFLLCFFPYYLQKALNQGLYKEYHRNEYNDSNVRGAIDVKRHIKLNIPFAGKVAYTMREYVYDNPVMQLIRHTIEYIKIHPFGKKILNSKSETIENVNKIIFHTPNYNKNDRLKIINFNIKKTVNHPYFSAYRELQKICIRILQKDKITFGEGKNKIYGLLFDGAWLWEEYLNKVFIEKNLGFTHAKNITREDPIFLFSGNEKSYRRYPDFYKDKFILDAKYKRLDKNENDIDTDDVEENAKIRLDRNDMSQIITYMYVRSADLGCFIYPTKRPEPEKPEDIGTLNGHGGKIKVFGFAIPQDKLNFKEFTEEIQRNESSVAKSIKLLSIGVHT